RPALCWDFRRNPCRTHAFDGLADECRDRFQRCPCHIRATSRRRHYRNYRNDTADTTSHLTAAKRNRKGSAKPTAKYAGHSVELNGASRPIYPLSTMLRDEGASIFQ